MEDKEIKEMMQSIRAVKEALKTRLGYMEPVWKIFIGVGVSVWIAYVLFQFVIWHNAARYAGFVWIGLFVAILLVTFIVPLTYKKSKAGRAKLELSFNSFAAIITFFALCVAGFIQALPPRENPVPLDKSFAVWIIAYAFILFSIGKYFSLPSFWISGIAVLVGIPLATAYPHFSYIISGTFLGLSIIVPSMIEIRRERKNE